MSRLMLALSIVVLVNVTAPILSAQDGMLSAQNSTGEVEQNSGNAAPEFLTLWEEWRSTAYTWSDLALAYRHETQTWLGEVVTDKYILSYGYPKDHPLVLIEAMQAEQLRDIEFYVSVEHAYSMQLPHALTLREKQRVISLPATIICQFFEKQPQTIVYEVDVPKGWYTRKLQIRYMWDYRMYDGEYDREFYWCPTEIRIQMLIKRGQRQAVLTEQWVLEAILEGPRTTTGPMQPATE